MDVDDPAAELLAQVVGEDLHVAGEHDQLDVLLAHQLQQPRLGLRLGVLRSPGCGGRGCRTSRPARRSRCGWRPRAAISTGSAPIRARNSRSFRQCPNLLTISTIRIRSSARWICQSIWKESPIAAKLARSFSTVTGGLRREVDPHEEQAGVVVAELLAVLDVAAGHEQIAGHGVHDALLVGAGQGEDVLVGRAAAARADCSAHAGTGVRTRGRASGRTVRYADRVMMRSTSSVRGGASGSSPSLAASRTCASRAARTASGQPWCSR